MPDNPGRRKPTRANLGRRSRSGGGNDAPGRRPGGAQMDGKGPPTFRARLRRDPFLFFMCLGFLFFSTSAFAVGWRVLSDPILLVLAVLSVPPAFLLFYLRDGARAS